MKSPEYIIVPEPIETASFTKDYMVVQHEVPGIYHFVVEKNNDPAFLHTVFAIRLYCVYKGEKQIFTAKQAISEEMMVSSGEKLEEIVKGEVISNLAKQIGAEYGLHEYVVSVLEKRIFEAVDGYKSEAIGGPTGGTPPNGGIIMSGAIHAGNINANPLSLGTGGGVSEISKKLPAMGQFVGMPCGCPSRAKLWNIVQHLNDKHDWTREKIADWIDELHDSGIINAEFQPWGSDEADEPEADESPLPTGWETIGYTNDYDEVFMIDPAEEFGSVVSSKFIIQKPVASSAFFDKEEFDYKMMQAELEAKFESDDFVNLKSAVEHATISMETMAKAIEGINNVNKD